MADSGTSPQVTGGPGSDQSRLEAYLEIKVVPERATLLVRANHALEKIVFTPAILEERLKREGVKQGLDLSLLKRILAEKLFDRTHIVAQAVQPKDGKDARIESLIKFESDSKPVVLKDGSTDYRNIENIHQVPDGSPLAIKHPATAGEPGSDVLGNPIMAKPGKDATFKVGPNVIITEDGLKAVASRGGYVYLKGDVICVGESFQVQGDVNFKTGNIHYHGKVHITGNVADGFSVEADEDIVIEGTVDGAQITSHQGSITVGGGIFGHGHTHLKAAKNITVNSLQDAHVDAGETLTINKEMRLCEATCGSLKADEPGCHILGGHTVSYGDARVAILGTEGVRTELRVSDKEQDQASGKLKAIDKELEHHRPLLPALEQKLQQIKLTAQRFHGHLPVHMAADLKATLTRYGDLQKKIREWETEAAHLQEIMKKPPEKRHPIVITEKLVDSAHIILYGKPAELNAGDAPSMWIDTDDGVIKSSVTGG